MPCEEVEAQLDGFLGTGRRSARRGVSLALGLAGLIGTAVLAVLWWRKSLVEERNLTARFPGYPEYRARVPRRFLPWLI